MGFNSCLVTFKIKSNSAISISTKPVQFVTMMIQRAISHLLNCNRSMIVSRSIGGLPKYDEASKIGMKQLWPAILAIAGLYTVGLSLNPISEMDMDPNKWKNGR